MHAAISLEAFLSVPHGLHRRHLLFRYNHPLSGITVSQPMNRYAYENIFHHPPYWNNKQIP